MWCEVDVAQGYGSDAVSSNRRSTRELYFLLTQPTARHRSPRNCTLPKSQAKSTRAIDQSHLALGFRAPPLEPLAPYKSHWGFTIGASPRKAFRGSSRFQEN
jgi:hypothetical protein